MAASNPGQILQFEDFRLEVGERRLTRGDTPISLPPKVFDLLVVLATSEGRLLEKEFLLQTLWPGTFVEEANLSVNVSALRRALGDGVGGLRLIETVPKRGYRFLAEVRAEGPAKETVAAVVADAASPSRRGVARWAIAAGVAGVAGWGGWAIWERRTPPMRSLAILPFLSSNAADRPLGLGMADALISRVSLIEQLEVRPTNAVAGFEDDKSDPQAIGRRLHVEALVLGRVDHVGPRVRVDVRLIRVADGKVMWTESFEDYFTNIFAMQDAIAERLALALAMPVPFRAQRKMSRRGTESTEAYQLYLQGQYLVSKRINEATLTAIDYFNQSIKVDAEYPLPYAALATSYLIRAGEGWDEPQLRDQAKTAALKALSLDAQSPEAHVAAGQVLMRSEWDWVGAEREFRHALDLQQSSAAAHAALGTLHTALGRHSEAIREAEIACRLDPASASLRSDLSWALLFARRFPQAEEEGQRATTLDVWSYTAHRQLSKAYLLQGKFEEALREARKTLEINGGRRRRVVAEVSAAMARAGRPSEAEAELREVLRAGWNEPLPAYEVAVAWAALGRKREALAALTQAVDRRLTRVVWIATDPELDGLRREADFQQLMRRTGHGER